jgi:peroxiredoxin Q/BCP
MAPDVSLVAADGTRVSVRDLYRDATLVLYFYPKDDTPGCTAEACSFRDAYTQFVDVGARVVGVSRDDAATHARFVDRHHLPFTLLSDPNGDAARAFDVKPSFLGLVAGRVTYVIDRRGHIRHAFDSQLRPAAHVREALDVVRTLR